LVEVTATTEDALVAEKLCVIVIESTTCQFAHILLAYAIHVFIFHWLTGHRSLPHATHIGPCLTAYTFLKIAAGNGAATALNESIGDSSFSKRGVSALRCLNRRSSSVGHFLKK
jgi:hypothetical protein